MASILEIILKAVKQGSGFKDTERDAASLSKAMAGLNKILGMAGLAIGAKELIDFGKASVDAALESATADAALQTALISTGQATAEYRAQLDALATSLENTTMFTDEQVAHAEASLVTFRNLGQDVMPRTIQVVADMGQKMGDLGAAAQLAGIALNAPEQAAARLQRQGIMLTQQQKDQIATFVEMGNIAGAQGIILDALNVKFGGQAAAAREAAGGMQDWVVSTGRLHEEFGKLILAIGESGVGGAATGLVDTLTEGATVWTSNVEQIQLFIDALNNANAKLLETSAASAATAEEMGLIQKVISGFDRDTILSGWGILLQQVTEAAIEGTVGFEALAESYGEVQAEADAAAQAATGVAAAISTTPAKVNPAQRAVKAFADSIRDLTDAQQENLNAPQTNQQADAYRQMAMGRVGMNDAALQAENEQNQRAADKKRAQEKEAAATSEQLFKESTQSMVEATSELGNQIASAVSSAVSQSSTDIAQLLGITPEGEARVNEGVRRMAAVATGGLANEWTQRLATQLQGVDAAQAFVNAVSTGNNAAAMEEARKLAVNPIVELFDANAIAAGIEQQLRAQQLQQVLNDKVNALLGEKGLPAVAAISQQVGQAATDTGIATGQVQQSTTDMAASAEVAAQKVGAAFAGALPQVDLLILRIAELIKMLERVVVVSQNAANGIAGLNPPAANGNGVPNEAQRRMGPLGPL